jgi:hypothetical protein
VSWVVGEARVIMISLSASPSQNDEMQITSTLPRCAYPKQIGIFRFVQRSIDQYSQRRSTPRGTV